MRKQLTIRKKITCPKCLHSFQMWDALWIAYRSSLLHNITFRTFLMSERFVSTCVTIKTNLLQHILCIWNALLTGVIVVFWRAVCLQCSQTDQMVASKLLVISLFEWKLCFWPSPIREIHGMRNEIGAIAKFLDSFTAHKCPLMHFVYRYNS